MTKFNWEKAKQRHTPEYTPSFNSGGKRAAVVRLLKQGLSTRAVANEVGIHTTAVKAIERQLKGPSRSTFLGHDQSPHPKSHGPAGPVTYPEIIVRVVAPDFVAGMIMQRNVIIDAAPVLKWTIGKQRNALRSYFKTKGWHATIVLPNKKDNQTSMKSG